MLETGYARPPVVLVHAGAGAWVRLDDALRRRIEDVLTSALVAGHEALRADAAGARRAVVEAVAHLEGCGLFNAGLGSVPAADGTLEFDAAVMDGYRVRAGAVAAVASVPSAIRVADEVLRDGRHVLLAGEGAHRFAAARGLAASAPATPLLSAGDEHDTVGAVALDRNGHLAAATSSGGVRGQLRGRVGDVPAIGAGTYADRELALSASGSGEALLCSVAAHDVAARVAYARVGLAVAAADVIGAIGADAALMALARDGRWVFAANTARFPRAQEDGDGRRRTAIDR